MKKIFLGMSWLDFKRVLRSGYLNFKRNGYVSVASVLVMTVTVLVVGSLIFLNAVLTHAIDQVEEKVDITVYFTLDAPESEILSMRGAIEQLPQVSTTHYVSKEEALIQFRERHQDDQLTLQALDELDSNPLGALLYVKAHNPSQYESIAAFLEDERGLQSSGTIVDKVNYHQNELIIERLHSLTEGARRLGLIITVVLAAVSIIVTFNTIRLTIYIAREEIGVMRLVGAENQYIRGPFIVEGIIYGAIAAILALLIFFPTTLWLGNTMTSFLGLNLFRYYLANFAQLFIILLLVGALLGILSSIFAIRRYLSR